jgi:WhiB family redox-sensing transcriptional regulator
VVREGKARAVCAECPVLIECRDWAREHREYGFWGGESEEERAAAGFRVDMPVGRVARYPKGDGKPVQPRTPKVA